MIHYNTQESSEFPLAPVGTYPAIVTEVDIYNNPSGEDKLIIKFSYSDKVTGETLVHSAFVTPAISTGDGFRVFADLVNLASLQAEAEGEIDEQLFVGIECLMTIAHVAGKGKHEGKTFANIVKLEAPIEEKSKKK